MHYIYFIALINLIIIFINRGADNKIKRTKINNYGKIFILRSGS